MGEPRCATSTANNRGRAFELVTSSGKRYAFPYARLEVRPSAGNRVVRVYPDPELGREALTYELESGEEGSVHLDSVREYQEDPEPAGRAL